jgi:hypothetical protein
MASLFLACHRVATAIKHQRVFQHENIFMGSQVSTFTKDVASLRNHKQCEISTALSFMLLNARFESCHEANRCNPGSSLHCFQTPSNMTKTASSDFRSCQLLKVVNRPVLMMRRDQV